MLLKYCTCLGRSIVDLVSYSSQDWVTCSRHLNVREKADQHSIGYFGMATEFSASDDFAETLHWHTLPPGPWYDGYVILVSDLLMSTLSTSLRGLLQMPLDIFFVPTRSWGWPVWRCPTQFVSSCQGSQFFIPGPLQDIWKGPTWPILIWGKRFHPWFRILVLQSRCVWRHQWASEPLELVCLPGSQLWSIQKK